MAARPINNRLNRVGNAGLTVGGGGVRRTGVFDRGLGRRARVGLSKVNGGATRSSIVFM